jgi:hypothetical protein
LGISGDRCEKKRIFFDQKLKERETLSLSLSLLLHTKSIQPERGTEGQRDRKER